MFEDKTLEQLEALKRMALTERVSISYNLSKIASLIRDIDEEIEKRGNDERTN
jgi:hypothetical protein